MADIFTLPVQQELSPEGQQKKAVENAARILIERLDRNYTTMSDSVRDEIVRVSSSPDHETSRRASKQENRDARHTSGHIRIQFAQLSFTADISGFLSRLDGAAVISENVKQLRGMLSYDPTLEHAYFFERTDGQHELRNKLNPGNGSA